MLFRSQYSPEVVRFFMLTAHYRSPINFSDEQLESAKQGLERLKTAVKSLKHRLETSAGFGEVGDWLERIDGFRKRFIKEMDDDFNSANGITVLFDLAKEANRYLREQQTSKEVLRSFLSMFQELADVLGISIDEEEELLDEEIERLIEMRTEARKKRDFALADKIRDQLKERGILLEDTPQGVRWKRV